MLQLAALEVLRARRQSASIHRKLGIPEAPQRGRDLGMRRHGREPLSELGSVGVAERDVPGSGQHPEHGAADVGERNVHAAERQGLGVRDQVGEPQAQGGRITENPVKCRAERIQIEQGLVDVEDDDRLPGHNAPFVKPGKDLGPPRPLAARGPPVPTLDVAAERLSGLERGGPADHRGGCPRSARADTVPVGGPAGRRARRRRGVPGPAPGQLEAVQAHAAAAEEANYRYYVLDDPQITDAKFDELLRELIELEEADPQLQTPDSPTQRVGAVASQRFAPFEHAKPMLSLANAASPDELRAFDERARKVAGGSVDYVCEPKIDGLAIALTIETARSRAAGHAATAVSARTLPQSAHDQDDSAAVASDTRRSEVLKARGEVYLRKSDFVALNRARERDGLPLFANPRNAASGGVRQLDPALTAQRRLSFFAYQLVSGENRARNGSRCAGSKRSAFRSIRTSSARRPSTSARLLPRNGRSGATSSITKSTAWSSRSTISRCKKSWASSRATRAGRSPLSSTARSAHPAARYFSERRTDRNAQSQRRARPGADRRSHGQECDLA